MLSLGQSPDLLSPQLEPKAIKHLCATCKITTVFADVRNYNIALELKDGILAINISNILRLHALRTDSASGAIPQAGSKSSDIAFLFHTSGTSSGLPKPIPQTHYAAVGVLPRLPGGEHHATFSTTPLYHGGIADCFRAWTSGSTIHLFPGTQPITAANVHRAVERANRYLQAAHPVKYFTSVPYILQMLLADSSTPTEHPPGITLLKSMDLVGVGGAALPPAVGEKLVSEGVRLVSRFGCAECGFLLTSHRDYAVDRDWSYLRAIPALQPDYYAFEQQSRQDGADGNSSDGGSDLEKASSASPPLFELVVKPEWPHRGKTNRPDGSFATADLFERHPTIPDAWRYHSRADAQITLISGKKFDPAPVEGELLSSPAGRRSLVDAMVFGTGRETPGVLLFPKWGGDFGGDEDVLSDVWLTIQQMNEGTQNHARIPRSSVVVVRARPGDSVELPKSSKGTILRGQAETMFAAEIEQAYDECASPGEDEKKFDIADSQVMGELVKIFTDVLGRRVDTSSDLFAQGVDSIACSQIRKKVTTTFFSSSDVVLPLNIIYDQGTVDQLHSYILRCRMSGAAVNTAVADEDEVSEQQLMLDLVEKYRHSIHSPTGSFDHKSERAIVLTGATGFLGAHILDLLLRDPTVSKIFCLVRATTHDDATKRISDSLSSRALSPDPSTPPTDNPRLVCLPSHLSRPKLGLTDDEWTTLASHTTMLIHSAWPVNFSLKLRSFEPQLAGLLNLLDLRDATRGSAARLVFISSTAAVSASDAHDQPIAETLSADPEDASPLGYSRSKWVAENICTSARVSGSFVVGGGVGPASPLPDEERAPVVVVRVGQLCGSGGRGAWNGTEVYPIMLSAAGKVTRSLPDLAGLPLSWLPVDLAARAVLELSFAGGGKYESGRRLMVQKTHVYHVANPHQEPAWSDLLDWVAGQEDEPAREGSSNGHAGRLEVVSPATWLEQLEAGLEKVEHPARSLLHLWKRTLAQDGEDQTILFDTRRAAGLSETMKTLSPLTREDALRMWQWIQSNV